MFLSCSIFRLLEILVICFEKEFSIQWWSDLNWTSQKTLPQLLLDGKPLFTFCNVMKARVRTTLSTASKNLCFGIFPSLTFLHFENIWILASLKREGSLADFERLEKRTAAAGKWLAFYPSLLNRVLLSLLWCPSFLNLSPLIINIVLSGQVREEFATFCKPWR